MRKNWGSAATSLSVSKLKMLPVGKYRLSVLWNSNLANMTNRSAYRLGEAATAIGEVTSGAKTLSYEFEVTESATPFDLILGFQKTGSGNAPAQLVVDDVRLVHIYTVPTDIDIVIPGDKALKDGKRLENGRIVIVKNGVKYRTNGQIVK